MTSPAALALSLLTLAVPQPPPAQPFAGLGAAPASPPAVELVDADGNVFGTLVSFGGTGGYWGPLFFAAAGGRIFALSQGGTMTPDGSIQTRYDNALTWVLWATPDCSGTAYSWAMPMGGGFPDGFVAQVAELMDGWHVVRLSEATGTITGYSQRDWTGACVRIANENPMTLNALEDLGPAPAFRSPLRPRVNVP